MKQLINIPIRKWRQGHRILLGFSLMLAMIVPLNAVAQADSTTSAEPEKKTYTPLIEFTSTQKNDNTIDLKASLKAKINGTLTKLEGMHVEFFSGTDSASNKLGEAMTDGKGEAILNCKAESLAPNAEGKLNFKLVFAGKDSIESAEEALAIKRARLDITPLKEDSLLTVSLKLIDLSTGTGTPVPETDLGVYVKRLFSNLKLGEGKTDASGEMSVEIPNELPGDEKGNITLLGRVDDNETYGNLEASVVQEWGTPVSYELKDLPRSLWSPHPPLWMLITFIILMSAVWGHYLVIIIQLIRLRKEEPEVH